MKSCINQVVLLTYWFLKGKDKVRITTKEGVLFETKLELAGWTVSHFELFFFF